MTSVLVPPWLGWLWVVALTVVAAVHLRHLVSLPDVTRAWHAGHVLMALGMIAMFWPHGALLAAPSGAVGRVVFVAAAVAAVVWALVDRVRSGRWALVWLLLAADMAVMVWMFLTMAPAGEAWGVLAHVGASTVALGAHAVLGTWFLLEALGWASGRLVRASEHDLHLELPVASGLEAVPSVTEGGSRAVRSREVPAGERAAPDGERATVAGAAGPAPHAWHGRSLRVTLTIMSASMACMLLAMAVEGGLGVGGAHGMEGM